MPCDTVDVQVPDDSSITIDNVIASSPSPNFIIVDFAISNNVESGSGETLSQDIETTFDGSTVDTRTITLGPGESTAQTVEISDVLGGPHEICVLKV